MKIDGTRTNDRATEVVLAYLSAFNRGDWAAMLALVSDGVVHDFHPGERESGKPAFAAYLRAYAHASEPSQLRDIVVMTSPDGARAAAEYLAYGEATGADGPSRPGVNRKRYMQPGGLFFAIRDGLIERVSNYQPRPNRDAPATTTATTAIVGALTG